MMDRKNITQPKIKLFGRLKYFYSFSINHEDLPVFRTLKSFLSNGDKVWF